MKKKYLILSLLISIALIFPVVYPRWKERWRLGRIDKIRSQALSRLEGMKLNDALRLLERGKPSFVILYTGNTKGYLETCGCFEGQSGGVARRMTAIEKREKFPVLLLDAGGIVQGEDQLDRLRSKIYLESMQMMGYDAVCPEEEEVGFISSSSSLPLVSVNLRSGTLPFIVKRVGGIRGCKGVKSLSPWMATDTLALRSVVHVMPMNMSNGRRHLMRALSERFSEGTGISIPIALSATRRGSDMRRDTK